MYLHQIQSLKTDLLKNPRFEACTLSGSSKGIKILGVVKLPNNINQNNHNVFIDLDNYRGNDYFIDDFIKSYNFDKPLNEVGADVPLWGAKTSIQIIGKNGTYSQVIENLSAHHTNYGHSSYLVIATLEENTVTIPDDTWLPNETEILAELKALRDRLDKLDKLIKELHG